MLPLKNASLILSQSYIAGEWVNAADGASIGVFNPSSGELLHEVSYLNSSYVEQAVDAAQDAGEQWRSTGARERSVLLMRWHDSILENKEDLAKLVTLEQGKPYAEALGEVYYAASYIEWFAEEAKRIDGDILQAPSTDKRVLVLKQPVGVVAAFTPWNFPIAMLTRKLAPALASGCTVIARPASETPLSALAITYLADQVGFPPGVINILVGARDIVHELVEHPNVAKITFTGSTEVGMALFAKGAQSSCKRFSLELGGNAPFIVFDDADIDAAVEGAIVSKFRNTGQTCVCANRFFVQEGVYREFIDKLTTRVSQLNVGDGLDKDVSVGPLINKKALTKVEQLIEDALSLGAKLELGGRHHAKGDLFYEPTVLSNVSLDARVFQEEIFGPVAPITKFNSVDEVIGLANDTDAGLAAYFYSRDLVKVWKVAEQLEYGMVGINEGIISNAMAPFGGVKHSGQGREGSKYGLDEYLELKYICLGGL